MGLKRHSQQLGSRAEASSRGKERSTTDGAILTRRLRLFSLRSFCWTGTAFSLRAHLRQVAQSAAPPGSRNGTRRWARVLATGQGSQETRLRGLFAKQRVQRGLGLGKQFVHPQGARQVYYSVCLSVKTTCGLQSLQQLQDVL